MSICKKHNLERSKSGDCKQCRKEYEHSDKGKATKLKYTTSEKCHATLEKWKKTPKGKKSLQKANQKWADKPEGVSQNRAHQSVHRAIREGKMVRQPCLICNNPESEAHHAWGYSKEHALHVVFLCKKHHTLVEKDSSLNETVKSRYLS
jgi:hypothetical protein